MAGGPTQSQVGKQILSGELGEHLNRNGLRIDLTGKDGLKENSHLGDRAGMGASADERDWDQVVGASVGTGVGGEMAWEAGVGAWAEARVVVEGRPVDLCWPGAASQISGEVFLWLDHP